MKFCAVVTSSGLLIPETDADYDLKKSLKVGETYMVEVKQLRNPSFHRKYFAMINTAWELLPQSVHEFFHTSEGFRKHVEITAGFFEPVFSYRLNEFVEMPKSIAWDKIEQKEFEELYTKVRMVLDALLTKYITEEEFNRLFLQF